jgi:MtN3 and saliva related transmembrane protein
MMLDYISYLAAFCTTFAFVPQALLIWKTKNTSSISLGMYSIFTTGAGLWFFYGMLTSQMALILANLITFLLALSILIMKILNSRKEIEQKPKDS